MYLNRTSRTIFESVSRENFWEIEQENGNELLYWRKQFGLDGWFREHTSIIEECSDEITKEQLEELVVFIEQKRTEDEQDSGYGTVEDANKIKELITTNDFENFVVYYTYCN